MVDNTAVQKLLNNEIEAPIQPYRLEVGCKHDALAEVIRVAGRKPSKITPPSCDSGDYILVFRFEDHRERSERNAMLSEQGLIEWSIQSPQPLIHRTVLDSVGFGEVLIETDSFEELEREVAAAKTWFNHCRSGLKPPDLPSRPDVLFHHAFDDAIQFRTWCDFVGWNHDKDNVEDDATVDLKFIDVPIPGSTTVN